MANQEHLDILSQGVEVWNQWREEHPEIQPDLSEADIGSPKIGGKDFSRINFSKTNLRQADLCGSFFIGADLSEADMVSAEVSQTNFSYANFHDAYVDDVSFLDADLRNANFSGIDLSTLKFLGANLKGADLSECDLGRADFTEADLTEANLTDTDLDDANFTNANLTNVDLTGANLNSTIFTNVDLSSVKGLETVVHQGPSSIGIDTIYRSGGNIPAAFLHDAGVPDSFIEYMRSLVVKPIEYYTCFISYSNKDQAFAERLYVDLQSKKVRCWFAPEDMKIGDKIRPRIDESIRMYDKLLLVLSQHSISSKWVEFEVETALDKEQEGKPPVLFPVRLDNTVMESTTAWASHIKRTRHIGDFTHWKDHDSYQKAFTRLLRDLKAEQPSRL